MGLFFLFLSAFEYQKRVLSHRWHPRSSGHCCGLAISCIGAIRVPSFTSQRASPRRKAAGPPSPCAAAWPRSTGQELVVAIWMEPTKCEEISSFSSPSCHYHTENLGSIPHPLPPRDMLPSMSDGKGGPHMANRAEKSFISPNAG